MILDRRHPRGGLRSKIIKTGRRNQPWITGASPAPDPGAHRCPSKGCPAPSRKGNPALRNSTSAGAPEQPVLDVPNQPDSHRPRRTERRVGARFSQAQDVVDCVAVPGCSPADSRPGCILYIGADVGTYCSAALGRVGRATSCRHGRAVRPQHRPAFGPKRPPDQSCRTGYVERGHHAEWWSRSGRTRADPPICIVSPGLSRGFGS
jgi:hypothetical protein